MAGGSVLLSVERWLTEGKKGQISYSIVFFSNGLRTAEWRHESRPPKFVQTNTSLQSTLHLTPIQKATRRIKFKNLGSLHNDLLI